MLQHLICCRRPRQTKHIRQIPVILVRPACRKHHKGDRRQHLDHRLPNPCAGACRQLRRVDRPQPQLLLPAHPETVIDIYPERIAVNHLNQISPIRIKPRSIRRNSLKPISVSVFPLRHLDHLGHTDLLTLLRHRRVMHPETHIKSHRSIRPHHTVCINSTVSRLKLRRLHAMYRCISRLFQCLKCPCNTRPISQYVRTFSRSTAARARSLPAEIIWRISSRSTV